MILSWCELATRFAWKIYFLFFLPVEAPVQCFEEVIARGDKASEIGLRVKLSQGLKLCKLHGRFLARVNNVIYIVNYKIFARACDLNKITCTFFSLPQ